MSELSIARRYAQALNEQADLKGVTDQVDVDIQMIHDGLSESRELARFFASPIISREKKADVVRALFSEKVDGVTLRFLELLVEKRRESVFPQMVTAYQELRDQQRGVKGVIARTAHSLSGSDLEKLTAALEQMTGNRIRLETKIDESIIGGIVIRVGDTVYDASVTNQLATLRERLETGSMA